MERLSKRTGALSMAICSKLGYVLNNTCVAFVLSAWDPLHGLYNESGRRAGQDACNDA